MAEIVKMSHLALHEQVSARLRTMLVEGRIAPGAKLNERELSEQLQVSRTPLREAIKLLAAEGLVDLLPNRGAVAVKLTEADVMHSFELLAELEGLSGALAAERIAEAEIAELRALHFEMMACHARRDLSGYYRLNARIHSAINEAAGNPVLAQTYRAINARVQSLRFRTNQDEAKWARALAEHQQMIEALAARDGARLREVLIQHVLAKRDAVLALLRDGAIYPAEAAR
ncbi:GntR family transcriptional regulator [Paucibacter sp. O1-1]|uniref:GntR family transcriptional regulator n=1 Tax=Roseateles TaxID=93681 RepID=UPI0021D4972A|nr:GntR family transcriptional regulator [Paucibacter sp. XJ19-41]MCU7369647.1 GntR family transcriptional regulator [Paucibacter sp. O1-1]MDA3824631.1 GntR family transcriptional regulator [Paucibacter sp. O1-1]MDC6166282.1 GntR family transcriptional regulator [Paucibacter sp. XJ19-41]